ncbi:MAG: hypothetical protein IKN55_09395 [Oscillospiraceae bacterium]|nr:hypothetical protein [Oscillospiraceae bacterium]
MNTNLAKLTELMENKSFAKELLSADSPETAQSLLADNGVEMSIEEIIAIAGALEKRLTSEADENADELSDSDLEEVAGGSDTGEALSDFLNITTDVVKKEVDFVIQTIFRRW